MFDENTSGENPEHIRFIKEVAIPLFESWGYEVKILHSTSTYLSNFYSIVNSPRTNIENTGKFRGFPVAGHCSIQRDCKKKPIHEFYNNLDEDYITYLGICADEPKRLASLHKNPHNISLLEEFGYTQKMSGELCKEFGLLSPFYSGDQKRGGCWFCMWAKEKELMSAKKAYPEAYDKFISLEDETENLCGKRWNCYGKKLRDVEVII